MNMRWFVVGLLLLVLLGNAASAEAFPPLDPPGDDGGAFPAFAAAGDSDGDTLLDTLERTLGTDPANPDSDCDYLDDAVEVGSNTAAPTDSDGDGRIDALENDFIDSDKDGTADQADTSGGTQLSCWYFKPYAVTNDASDSSTVEVRVEGSGVTGVAITNASDTNLLTVDSATITPSSTISLYDDGTHGDRAAGDRVWSRGNIRGVNGGSVSSRALVKFSHLQVTAGGSTTSYQFNQVTSSMFSPLQIAVVNSALIKPVTTDASRGLQTTGRFANIVSPRTAVNIKRYSNRSEGNKAAAREFYRFFPDDYDFIVTFAQGPALGGFPSAYSASIKNDTQHIGKGIFNQTAAYGSAGKLQNFIVMNFATSGPLTHEIMHRWAVYGNVWQNLHFNQCTDTAHWGYAGVGIGVLGGFDPATFQKVGDGAGYQIFSVGAFTPNVNRTEVYSPVERYLAGFLAAEDVPDIIIPLDVDCDSVDFDSSTMRMSFHASGYNTLSMAQLAQNLGGERVPNLANAQKDYRFAFVMFSDKLLTPAEMAMFDYWSVAFSADTPVSGMLNFKQSSGGVATADTTINMPPAPKKVYLPSLSR